MMNESVHGSVRITVIDWRTGTQLFDESIYLGDFAEDPTALLCRTTMTKYAPHLQVISTYLERGAEQVKAIHQNMVEGAMSDSKHRT